MTPLTQLEWEEMNRFFEHRCVKCNRERGWYSRLTKDHIRPKSRGGLDIVENIQPMCRFCNLEKGNVSHKDWRPLAAKILGKELPEKYISKPLPSFEEWKKIKRELKQTR